MKLIPTLLRPLPRGTSWLMVLAGLICPWVSGLAQFDPGPEWIRRDPVNVSLNAVAFGLNRFIAVGNNGYWFTSPNGLTWTVRAPLTDGPLNAIHFSGGRFVAVGDGVYSSTDGVSWAKADLADVRVSLLDVADDDAGNWLAVGRTIQPDGTPGNGVTFASADGILWSLAALGGAPAKIAFGAGQWFGADPINSNLSRWESIPVEPGNPPEFGWASFFLDDLELPQPTGKLIRFLDGRFILAGYNSQDDPLGAHHVFTSTDGINWPKGTVTNQGIPTDGANQARYSVMRDVAYGGGVYVGIAAGSPSSIDDTWSRADAMTSTDGVNWAFIDRASLSTATVSRALTGITHANGQFVAVGYRGTTPLRITVVTTLDGLTWTSRGYSPTVFQRSANESAVAVASGDGLVVAVTQYGGAAVSDDNGVMWGYAEVTANLGLGTIAHGGGRFVAGGQQGWAYRSTDGTSWSSVHVPDAFHIWDVIHDGTRFVAVGQYRDAGNAVQRGIASRSTDGASWSTVQIPDTARLEEAAFGNSVYVALGVTQAPSLRTVQVSADAAVWSAVNGAPELTRVAFGGGRFLGATGVEGNPQFYTSTDGLDWTLIEATAGLFIPPFFTVETLAFQNGHFVMGGSELGIYFLENDRWVSKNGPNRAAVTFSEDTYVATSLWTTTLPPAEPPLEPPSLTWERSSDLLGVRFPARLEHRYQLWERSGLDNGSQWIERENFIALEAAGQFEIPIHAGSGPLWLYRISVEPPTGP